MPAVNKKVKLGLDGLNGNAFALMGAFQRQAKQEKWTAEEIKAVLDDCQSSNYDHLLCVLMDHCEDPDNESSGDELSEDDLVRPNDEEDWDDDDDEPFPEDSDE